MKKLFFILMIYPFCLSLLAQPFPIGHTTITFTDPTRNNRNITTEIYYPADVAGENVPVTTANADQFPVLSFGHGFVMTWDAYQNIWDALVPQGFIMAFPTTEGGFSPSHLEFGKDIAFVITAMTALDQNNASLFFNRVDAMNGVMGHSMGGGSAFLAAQWSPAVKALATLAPAETTPSAIQAAASLAIPSLVLAGTNDCITPPNTNQIPMYDALASSCKTYIGITGGSHCQMANNNILCSFGEATCTPPPSITRAAQHSSINQYLIPWLKYTLKGDCAAGALFDAFISEDSSIVYQKNCSLCTASSVNAFDSNFSIEVFPNPFDEALYVRCQNTTSSVARVDLSGMDGIKIYTQNMTIGQGNDTFQLSFPDNLPTGIYLLALTVQGATIRKKIIHR